MVKQVLTILLLCCYYSTPLHCAGHGLPQALPGQAGMDSTRLVRIGELLEGYVRRGELAGVIGVVARHGKIAYFTCHGVRDLTSGQPLRDNSIFRIYSMTKPVASVALMVLWERGLFQLDDPVERYVPEFADIKVYRPAGSGYQLDELKRKITIGQLLTHTAALNYDYPEGSELRHQYQELEKNKHAGTLRQWVGELVKFPISHQPDSKWQYSTPSTDMVGYLVEVLSGQSFDSFLRTKIFEPLQMRDTGFHVPGEKQERFTAMYGPPSGESSVLTLLDEVDSKRYASGQVTFYSGGGGLVSTAHDYIRFAQMMLNGGELDGVRILGRKTVELITTNHLRPEMIPFGFSDPRLEYVTRGWGFGLGYAVLLDVPLHGMPGSAGTYKWAGAANTDHWIDPGEQLIGLLLTQFMPNGHYPLDRQFRTLVYQAVTD